MTLKAETLYEFSPRYHHAPPFGAFNWKFYNCAAPTFPQLPLKLDNHLCQLPSPPSNSETLFVFSTPTIISNRPRILSSRTTGVLRPLLPSCLSLAFFSSYEPSILKRGTLQPIITKKSFSNLQIKRRSIHTLPTSLSRLRTLKSHHHDSRSRARSGAYTPCRATGISVCKPCAMDRNTGCHSGREDYRADRRNRPCRHTGWYGQADTSIQVRGLRCRALTSAADPLLQ